MHQVLMSFQSSDDGGEDILPSPSSNCIYLAETQHIAETYCKTILAQAKQIGITLGHGDPDERLCCAIRLAFNNNVYFFSLMGLSNHPGE